MTLATPASADAGGPRLLVAAMLVSLVGAAALFWPAIANLWERWSGQEELSHSYFIPLISGWLVWTNRDRVRRSVGPVSFAGLPFLALGGALHLLGGVAESFLFQQLGLVSVIAGLTATFGGPSLLRTTAPPIAFLLFAVPPPFMLITLLSWRFQLISSELGVAMIKLMGIPVFLSGNVIDLGDYQLQVAEACSGLRYLFPFISLGVMSAFIYRGPLWHKAVIVAATVPITILMNSLRIGLTGALVQAFGTAHAEGVLHFFEGWVVFVFCLVALFGVIEALGLRRRPRVHAIDALGAPFLRETAPRSLAAPRWILAAPVAIGLCVSALSSAVTVDELIKPARKPFALMPGEFRGWTYEVRDINPTVADVIGADDTIVFDLAAPDGARYNLYLAYLEARREGRSWHSPQQCIPGGGWQIIDQRVVESTKPSGLPLTYNRMVIENRGQRQLVYYWYDQRGRTIADEYMMRLWLTVDAVARKRSDGAMVRLITAVEDGEALSDADDRLDRLISELDPFLADYIPH